MRMKIEIEGDYYEDRDQFALLHNAPAMYYAISMAKNEIRCRLKHGEGLTEEEERFLEMLQDHLHVEELDV